MAEASSPQVMTGAAAVRDTLETMEAAERYNAWLYDRARAYLGQRVLDVGAGIGSFTQRLLADGMTVTAVEPDAALVAMLRDRLGSHPRLTIVEGEVADAAGTFDAAICLNVLEHIHDDEQVVRDIGERLAPSGRLLVLVPAHPALFGGIDRAIGHERRYSAPGLLSLLADAGFDVALLRSVNPLGAVGWFVSARVLRRTRIPARPLRLYDSLVPLLRLLDGVRIPFGLSLWAVATRRAPTTKSVR